MNPRLLLREVRDFPATVLFSASWLVVFAAMLALRFREDSAMTIGRVFLSGMGDGGRLGDLTLLDLARGEYWRLITCNFVHYSVVHIALNLFAFYMLGTLLESWYGSWSLIAIYGTTGVGGNLISALARGAMGANPLVHSGGGSVVIMGLIGLCATAGWASRSSRDRELTWQMLKALAITGALGLIFPRYIDNWGHAGGALVGLPIGLLHVRLLAGRGRPRAFGPGAVWALVLLTGAAAQVRADRSGRDARALVETARELDRGSAAYRVLQTTRRWAVLGGDAPGMYRSLRSQSGRLDQGPTRAPYRRLLRLASEFSGRKPTPVERQSFRRELEAVRKPLRDDLGSRLRTYWNLRRSIRITVRRPAPTRPMRKPAPFQPAWIRPAPVGPGRR